MDKENYLEKIDTFKNTLLTHGNHAQSICNRIVNDSEIHVITISKTESFADIASTWNNIARDIEELVEVMGYIMEDFENYTKLWNDYINVDEN